MECISYQLSCKISKSVTGLSTNHANVQLSTEPDFANLQIAVSLDAHAIYIGLYLSCICSLLHFNETISSSNAC